MITLRHAERSEASQKLGFFSLQKYGRPQNDARVLGCSPLDSPMKIRLADYKEGVEKAVREDYDPRALDLEFVDLKYSKPLALQGTVEKNLDSLTFRGTLENETEQICGRCLKTISRAVHKDFELFYETKGLEEVDTTDDLREVLIIDHPISFVCQENCHGLCLKCGANRNETQCGCVVEEPKISSSFADLKKIWNQAKKRREE